MEAIARITFNNAFASEVLAQYSHHVRSLELEKTELIDSYDISFTNLSHLMYDERMDNNHHFQHETEDPYPIWSEAQQSSVLTLIKRNRGLRSIELTIRRPADPILFGDVLRDLPCLETLELDGPDFEHEGIFWNLLKTSPVLRSATFRNWSQNHLTVDPRHRLQDKNNVINVRRLSLSRCGSALSLAHSFPVLEALYIYQISDLNAQDLATLLSKGHAPKLRRLHVIETTTHLDKILKHAPALEYFALTNGQISPKIGPPTLLPGHTIYTYNAVLEPVHVVFANIMNIILKAHAHNLQEFVFTLNMPFKDQKGLLMQVLAACPNLTRFYCMVPVNLVKFLEVEAVAGKLEELNLSLVLPRADKLSDEEKLQREEQLLSRLIQYRELKRFELARRGAAGYSTGDIAMPLDRAKAVEAMSSMKKLEFISLYSHEYVYDDSEWKYTKRLGAL
ncbi:hypothetical protein BGZ93_003408 [Podila epicladia]|nr:hypothetical protein BGZ93_003408 [Podila epicladia]